MKVLLVCTVVLFVIVVLLRILTSNSHGIGSLDKEMRSARAGFFCGRRKVK